ncbi:MAG: flavin reductase [Coriobacteriia bacterium]|nr:flavin reductase [Coriobacteriia bacterium]
MVDRKAFFSLSYGVYVISAVDAGKQAGCIVNTFNQVTSSPARVSVTVNKENFTTGVILASGRFEASVLAQSAPMELIGRFGFKSSADIDKFAETEYALDEAGVPYVTEHVVAHIGARVIETVDVGTHMLIVGEVEDAAVLSNEEPMTYAYYHEVKGGKTPPKASSYTPDEPEAAPAAEPAPAARIGWKCKICGYVVEMDELPEDFKCPICGMGREMFERVEIPA